MPFANTAGDASQCFFAGTGSFEAIRSLREAIGDEAAVLAILPYALGDFLRIAGRHDGTIDRDRLASWRSSHADALRALPGLDAHLDDAGRASGFIADVIANRRAAGAATRRAALARVLGMAAPEGVSGMIGAALVAKDATARMKAIRQAIGSDREARQGLRRAVVETLIAKAVGGEARECGISDAFEGIVRQSEAAIREASFAPGEVRILDAIFAEACRAFRSDLAGEPIEEAGGSQRSGGSFVDGTPFRAILSTISAACDVEAATVGAAAVVSAARRAGLRTAADLASDAMVSPERARLLLSKAKPADEAARTRDLIISFARAALQALTAEEKHRDDAPRFSDDPRDAMQMLAMAGGAKRMPGNVRSSSDGSLSNVQATIARDREAREAILEARERRFAHLKPAEGSKDERICSSDAWTSRAGSRPHVMGC